MGTEQIALSHTCTCTTKKKEEEWEVGQEEEEEMRTMKDKSKLWVLKLLGFQNCRKEIVTSSNKTISNNYTHDK